MTASTLHLTNGVVAADRIRASGLGGEVFSWRDVLHEGPTPRGLSLDEMSRVRARFLSECPWGRPFEQELADLQQRDSRLKAFKQYAEVVLWFEHDLYDQLQLIQVLHWFAMRDRAATPLSMICIGAFPGVDDFRGLGQLEPEQVASLYPERVPVGEEVLEQGRTAWSAFTSDVPDRLQEFAKAGHAALPFLSAAFERLLQEYPSTRDGLSRCERQILETIVGGTVELDAVYRVSQIEREERPFMADLPYLLRVRALCEGLQPLLELEGGADFSSGADRCYGREFWKRKLHATESGSRVISGQADRSRFLIFDRWIGGVHLSGRTAAWRWGHRTGALIAQ